MPDDRPFDERPLEDAEERHRRGLRFRKRDDHAIELFREAEAHLADIARVNRILLELGRYYNPAVDGPIVDLATRRRIVELLESRREEEARRLLDERLALYARIEGEE
ncbi:MAG: hypothetical protein HYU25_17225 [Candidatus Rokubacteria bacterium]|nr:hypothetical protein [Candidatus Rokubacteria bacterium]